MLESVKPLPWRFMYPPTSSLWMISMVAEEPRNSD
jgi:hypothetical protein